MLEIIFFVRGFQIHLLGHHVVRRIVIGGDVAELGDPTSTLRGLLDADAAVTVVTTLPPGHPVPAGVQAILEVYNGFIHPLLF